MANLLFPKEFTPYDQLRLMQEDARYDVADGAGSDTVCMPDLSAFTDIRSARGAVKVPKLFLSNNCIFNCAYCGCRTTNDKMRYCHEPKMLAKLAVDEAQKNGHGVFITSAICQNADYTEERIVETIKCMREDYHYTGYIHAKVMPGADPLLIRQAGLYADRLSVNIEVAKSEGYARIAKQKNKENILTPMQQISDFIRQAKEEKGAAGQFACSQTTQLMAGSIGESDRTIMNLSRALYKKYHLKRVYYSAFQYRYQAKGYDLPFVSTPVWRMHRLYQADRLLHLYGFTPDDVTPKDAPNLSSDLDPKAAWALRNMGSFPIEVNTADYETLLRVPGIGIVYAKKILRARKWGTIRFETLAHLGIPLKRARFFITCSGQYMGGAYYDNPEILAKYLASGQGKAEQMTFDTAF